MEIMGGRFCEIGCTCARHNKRTQPRDKCQPGCMCYLHWRPKHIIMCGVYLIRCTVNSKQYIGSSIDIYKRFSYHQSSLKQGINKSKLMQEDYNLYGKESFVYEVLEIMPKDTPVIDIRNREQHWFDSLHPEYNVQPNAISAIGWRGWSWKRG